MIKKTNYFTHRKLTPMVDQGFTHNQPGIIRMYKAIVSKRNAYYILFLFSRSTVSLTAH